MKFKNNIVEIFIIFGGLLLLFYSSDPVIYSDSGRYIYGSPLDPPMYSKIIKIMLSMFETLNSVVVLQTLLISFAIIYFTRTIAIHFDLGILTKVFISLLLFLPILQFYNNLLTEPLSYAFSLFFVSSVFKLIFNYSYQNLFWVTFFIVALLLTRNQFMFLYPVVLLLYVGIFILFRSKSAATWLIASFLSVFLIHNSLIFLNTYVKDDSFNTQKLTYVRLGPFFYTYLDAIYISTNKDIKLFKNQNSQKTLSRIFEEMDNREALGKHYTGRGHFGYSLGHIKEYSEPLLKNLANQENTDVISLKKEISFILLKANFGKYVKHVFKKFYDSSWLFVFVPFFILLAGLTSFFKYKSHLSLLVIFISSFSLSNHFVIYLFGRVQPRYFIYTDFILLIFIFLLFNIFLQKKLDPLIKQ
jgi:hypothetical protein